MDKQDICQFSPSGNIFALSSGGIIKFWNANTGVLEHQYHPAEHLAATATCISFCPMPSTKGKKKKSKDIEDAPPDFFINGQMVALGTLSGKILIYSIVRQELICTLEHSFISPVVDLLWAVSNAIILVSLSSDKTLIKWNIVQNEKIVSTEVAGDSSICQYGTNLYINAGTCLQKLKLSKNECLLQEPYSTGQSIFKLFPVKVCGEKTAQYVLSASRDDRFVYVWSIESFDQIASFKVGDFVRSMSFVVVGDSLLVLAVTTKKGVLRLFRHQLNGRSGSKKPIHRSSELVVNSIVIDNQKGVGDGRNNLEIVSCLFISDDTLAFAYSLQFPTCEKISLKQLEKDVTLLRMDPKLRRNKSASLIKTVIPSIPANAAHIMPNSGEVIEDELLTRESKGHKRKKGDPKESLPLEECLNALSIKQPQFSIATGGAPLNNNVQLLVQGLHSKDDRLLQSILVKGEDDDLVNNTVKRLPAACIEPFIKYLQQAMTKGVKNLSYMKWLKSILNHHMSHLSSMSSKKSLMMPFHSVCAARMTTLPEVTKLHSRLNLILTHISARHENANQTDVLHPALLTYNEDSEEESDKDMRDHRLPSESEDFWDDLDLSDEEEEDDEIISTNGHMNGDDEEKDTSLTTSTRKRKTSEKDEEMEVSEDEVEPMVNGDVESDEEEDDNDEGGEDRSTPSKSPIGEIEEIPSDPPRISVL